MKLEHSFTVPAAIDEAWKILLDIERIGPCMPGAAVDTVDGDDFTGSVKVKLGPIGLTYKGKASFVEKDEAVHRAVIDARGKDARGNGTASAKVTATLSDRGGETHVQVDTDLDITGKPAQFGRGVMVDVGNKLIGKFADNLAAEISSAGPAVVSIEDSPEPATTSLGAAPTPQPGDAAAPTPSPTDHTPTPTDDTPVPTDDTPTPADRTPRTAADAAAAGAPESGAALSPAATVSGAGSTMNGSSAPGSAAGRHAAPDEREVEPIDLLESAGPAVAKRLAPPLAALALLVVVIVFRRRRG